MTEPLASLQDLLDRPHPAVVEEQPHQAEVLLGDASQYVRDRARRAGVDIDADIAAGRLSARTAMVVTLAVVRRTLADRDTDEPDETTVGPFAWKYSRPEPNLWLRDDELLMLGVATDPPPRGFFGDRGSWPG